MFTEINCAILLTCRTDCLTTSIHHISKKKTTGQQLLSCIENVKNTNTLVKMLF